MKFETEESSHRTLFAHGNPLENLVTMDALVSAHPKRNGIHEAHTGAFAPKHFLFKLHKAILCYSFLDNYIISNSR